MGRGVADVIRTEGTGGLFAPEIAEVTRAADVFVLNLECCISDRGDRWPDPDKPFFFRAPPPAAQALADLGVDAVTLANNHALDYRAGALLDTIEHLGAAGIAVVGAGADVREARTPARLQADGVTVAIVGLTDHPASYAAGPDEPGVAFADLRSAVPAWVVETVAGADADVVVALPHWGPNMTAAPVRHVRRAGEALLSAGAGLVAGHSAHVFHGVDPPILWDLGDFIDDYAVDPRLRNDHGLLWLVHFDGVRPVQIEALPLALEYGHTRLALADEAAWIGKRLDLACAEFGTPVHRQDGRMVIPVV